MKAFLSLSMPLLFCALSLLQADEIKSVTYSPHAAHYGCQLNMGPTGARAWMRGYHLVVVSVDQGSPSYEILQPLDVVIGADGVDFGKENDPRITLGGAIGRAEADGSPLKLMVMRGKKIMTLGVPLKVFGEYAEHWPYNCEKSNRILDLACRSLLHAQLPSGEIVTDGGMGTSLGGLLMLASNDPKYLDGARRAAYSVAGEDRGAEGKKGNWSAGYDGVLLAEYYLATGDDSVLGGLKEIVAQICRGQMSSGGWGHNTPHGAYGTLNQVGIICSMALVLAKECGIEVDSEVMDKSLELFGSYAQLGAVPYGDMHPYFRNLDANGRNASAAILMHLAGQSEKRDDYAASVAESYWEREEGHTGGYFSIIWGPLATSMAGKDKLKTFMDYQKWYYNLARTWRGELVMLPYYEALTRFDGNSYNHAGGDFTTGGMSLAFALPHQKLRILGAKKSVFSHDVNPESAPLKKALRHYLNREWKSFDSTVSEFKDSELKREDERRWLRQLKGARSFSQKATDILLLEVDSNLEEGVPYRSAQQIEMLKQCLGEELDSRFEALDKRLAGKSWHINEGKMYHEAWRELRVISIKSWVPQGDQTKWMMEGTPSTTRPIWEPLSPTSQLVPQEWRSIVLKEKEELPVDWMQEKFDDSSWVKGEKSLTSYDDLVLGLDEKAKAEKLKSLTREDRKALETLTVAARRVFMVEDPNGVALRVRLQTVRPAETKVYLNGRLIAQAVRGQRGGYASIPLDDSVFSVLKKGENLLAVTCDANGQGSNHMDVGLEINRVKNELRTLPTHRARAIALPIEEGVDNEMRVREVKDRKLAEIASEFDAMSLDELVGQMKSRIGFYRYQAEEAMVRKGAEGLSTALNHLSDLDWRVRSSVCRVVQRFLTLDNIEEEVDKDYRDRVSNSIKKIASLLEDEHHWVRVRALGAMGETGEAGSVYVSQIMGLLHDEDPWVRVDAIKAISKLHTKPEEGVTAAIKTLSYPNTAFSAPIQAFKLLQKYPEQTKERLDALMFMFKNTPQGMGGRRALRPMMDMAFELDPEGKVFAPFLTEAVSGKTGLSRQQANPPAKALELLGQYGEKALVAVPVLESILASESKEDKGRHESVRAVLKKIKVGSSQ